MRRLWVQLPWVAFLFGLPLSAHFFFPTTKSLLHTINYAGSNMEQRKYGFTVTEQHSGLSLYDYLASQMVHFSENSLKKMIHNGIVRVNKEVADIYTRLKAGDDVKVRIAPTDLEEYEIAPSLTILFENDQFLVVDKPSGLAVVQERWKHDNFFKDALLEHFEETNQKDALPLSVHRIDKETSGALLVAKNKDMERYLCQLLENHEIRKEYLAVVSGVPQDKGRIELKIAQASEKENRMMISDTGKEAITNYELVEVLGDFSILRVTIETGRTHQIRLHLSAIGYPLAIDPIYGYRSSLKLSEIKNGYKPKKGETEKPILSRLTLHSHKISFQLPDQTPFTAEAPIPSDLQLFIKMLRKYRPQKAVPKLGEN